MIFKTLQNDVIRIPDNLLCGRMTSGSRECFVWPHGDEDAVYDVSPETFVTILKLTGDKETE